jgi:hypothetical protein
LDRPMDPKFTATSPHPPLMGIRCGSLRHDRLAEPTQA